MANSIGRTNAVRYDAAQYTEGEYKVSKLSKKCKKAKIDKEKKYGWNHSSQKAKVV